VGDASILARQIVAVTEITGGSAQGEWFATPHVALRGHVTYGGGSIVSEAWRQTAELGIDTRNHELGQVQLTTYDVAVSVWPFVPRSQGFAPYVTVGIGTANYRLRETGDIDGLFTGHGVRRRRTMAWGAGADMAVWPSVMLRVEAINHRASLPFEDGDFALDGLSRDRLRQTLADDVSNVRFSMGAYVYVP
ncbi:MAG TPA: outer membrane beta-barrel protein, partial [Longimicrobiales bacterium]|nr:outer membrane beta-barrel protein [Longimicrobiales bacterium]